MKKLKKMLLPSIGLLMASIVALTGVTFAWFTSGNSSELGAFDANVTTAEGMLMSWDAVTWKSELSLKDSEYSAKLPNAATGSNDIANNNTTGLGYGDTDATFTYFPRSTTANTITNGALTFYDATVSNNKLTESEVSNTGYVKFDLYFQLTAESNDIVLNASSVVNSSNADETQNISWASRVAFVYQGVDTTSTPNTAYKLGTSDATTPNSSANSVQIWEPNATSHTTNGAADGIYDKTGSSAVKYSYFGIENPFTVAEGTAANTVTAPLDRKVAATASDTSTNLLTAVTTKTNNADVENDQIAFNDIPAGIAKITVYIWVEGQDADCTNVLANTNLQVTMGFTRVVEETQG